MAVRFSVLCAGSALLPTNIFFPPYAFLLEAEPSAAGRIRPIEKINDLIGSRTRDLKACSIEP
jgi:hypothetical protein